MSTYLQVAMAMAMHASYNQDGKIMIEEEGLFSLLSFHPKTEQ